jgi:Ca2+-binding RTX toxin-like protein
MAYIQGTDNDDNLIGSSESDSIFGLAGNDTINGGSGDDYLDGDTGNDVINAGDGNDYIYAGTGINTVDGGSGNDYLSLSLSDINSNLTLTYTDSNNGNISNGSSFKNIESLYIYTGSGDNEINVSAANNASITTGAGNDTITATVGDDYIYSGDGNDVINAGDGNDSIDAGSGINIVDGGSGNDYLSLNLLDITSNLTVTYTDSNNGNISNGSSFKNIESLSIYTGSGDDDINVSAANSASIRTGITTGAGNDTITATAGDDYIYSGDGNDVINAGDGNDYIDAGTGINIVDGGDGNDTLSLNYYNETGDITVNFTNPFSSNVSNGTTFVNIENINLVAGSGNDNITSSLGNYFLDGGSGNDTLNGGAGNDTLFGGNGNDILNGGYGDDHINSSDYYSIAISDNIDTIDGGEGNDSLNLDLSFKNDNLIVSYTDTNNGFVSNGLTFKNIETLQLFTGSGDDNINVSAAITSTVYGYSGNDRIISGRGNDILDGGDGNDVIYGDYSPSSLLHYLIGGDDLLNGGDGNDLLNGGVGNDILVGGNGIDTLVGGLGNDKFVYRNINEAGDTITDFRTNKDVIVLTDLLQSLGYGGGSSAISDGYVTWTQSGNNTLVQIDSNGLSNGANFTTLASLTNTVASSLSASSFVF